MKDRLSRRDFLQASSASAGFIWAGATSPSLLSAEILDANDRINVGVIGVGGIGSHHIRLMLEHIQQENTRLVAISDVYRRRLTRTLAMSRGEAYEDGEGGLIPADSSRKGSLTDSDAYMDYRRLLERKDVDAVFICTPDHWHAKMAIDSLEAGKHVYLEKPMTLTIEQAIAVRDAVRGTQKVLQVGPQGTSDDLYRKAQAAIREGRIGKVNFAQAGGGSNPREHIYDAWFKIDPSAGPHGSGDDYIDWDMWLGHRFGLAPKIPFNPEHVFRFRKYWPYSGGQVSDLLYHSLAPLLLAIVGPNGAYPRRAAGAGGQYVFKDDRDIPDVCVVALDYLDDYTILLVNNFGNAAKIPSLICGRHGTIELGDEIRLRVAGDFAEEFKEKNHGYTEVTMQREPYEDSNNAEGIYNAHRMNFFNAIRGLEAPHCNAELGAATMVGIKMAVDSYRLKKPLLWDSAREKVVG
ncbi:MAG: hypothetical protein GEU99_03310 [Luteitalea sp.]|nr:hypothetical protein [Luteitalea sp.]